MQSVNQLRERPEQTHDLQCGNATIDEDPDQTFYINAEPNFAIIS